MSPAGARRPSKFHRNQFAAGAFLMWSASQSRPNARGPSMSDLARTQRRERTVSCPRCGTPMDKVVSIAPSLGEPGLIGYECPNCVYVMSELVQPANSTDQHAA